MKKVYTDCLIQVAVILSLMRPDLNDYLYDYEVEEPEIQDYFMGESLAYLQTSFHPSRSHIINSPKSVIERDMYIRDLIRDLSRPRRFSPVGNRNLDAYLVSEVTGQAPAPAQETSTGSTQTDSSTELSKEEMNLIEVLWQQDVERESENHSQSPADDEKLDSQASSASDVNNNRDVRGDVSDVDKAGDVEETLLLVNQETGELERPVRNDLLPEFEDDMAAEPLSLEEAVRALEDQLSSDWTSHTMYAYPDTAHFSAPPVMAPPAQYGAPYRAPHGYPPSYGASYGFPGALLTSPDQSWTNSSDFLTDPSASNFTLLPPSLTATNTSMSPTYSQNSTMNTAVNMTSLISEIESASLFPNITSVSGPPPVYNSTPAGQSMIDLLDSEDLDMMDLDHLNFTSESGSMRASASSPVSTSDSAVSMGSGGSPLTVSASPSYEGATGGHDHYSNKYKYVKPDYDYYDSGELRLDRLGFDPAYFNSSGNQSYYDPAGAVAHNHTYMSSDPVPSKLKQQVKLTPSRDAQKARQMNLPLSYDEIIEIPVEELTGVLQKYSLTDDQVQLIRDIRRRGKNKLAAQNCRKRRIQEIEELESEVEEQRKEQMRLDEERRCLEKELIMVRSGYDRLYDSVFRSLRNQDGELYDPGSVSLEMNAEGRFVLVPRNSTGEHRDNKTKRKK